jgi:alkylation response protein AidB-like acyl-CoA dehydrogenase
VDLLLDEPQRIFADTAARLCSDLAGAKRLRALRQAGDELDREAWRAAIAAGWLSTLAERDGADGAGAFDLALALEQAGRQLMLIPLAEAGAVVLTLAQVPAQAETLAGLLAGERLIVPATEPPGMRFGPGGDGVRLDDRTGELNGEVTFVPYARSADTFLVDAGSAMCLIPAAASGVTVTAGANVDGSMMGRIAFGHVQVPAAGVVARGADAQRLVARMQEFLALGVAAELIGLAAGALDVTLDYIKLRQQFGKPIGSFQILQHRAVDGFIDIELDRSLLYRVLAEFDAGEHHPAMVDAVKARASRTAFKIVREALQMHGAIGYTEEHDIGLYYKRAIALGACYGGEMSRTAQFSRLTLDAEASRQGAHHER